MKTFIKGIRHVLEIAMLFAFIGCSHRLEIKNLADYRSTSINPLAKKISIGIVSTEEDVHMKRIVRDLGMELQKYSGEVVYPYFSNSMKKVDVVADVRITPEYKGSWANFFVNWPGFLIWTPAWHGYNYNVKYTLDVALIDGNSSQKFDEFSSTFKLKVRHAEMDRTWTEISWLEVSALAFFGGLYSMNYDPDVTPLVAEAAGGTVGENIAEQIVARINNSGRFAFLYYLGKDVQEMMALR